MDAWGSSPYAARVTRPTAATNGALDGSAPVDVMLVCSAGGHLLQLSLLSEAWREISHAWVTLDRDDAAALLEGQRVFYAHGPTNRNIVNLMRNIPLAWRLLRALKPKVMVTTGAGIAVPFAWVARVRKVKVVYVESLTRIDSPSLSYRLVRPVTSRVYVQWPELASAVPEARYVGSLLESS